MDGESGPLFSPPPPRPLVLKFVATHGVAQGLSADTDCWYARLIGRTGRHVYTVTFAL